VLSSVIVGWAIQLLLESSPKAVIELRRAANETDFRPDMRAYVGDLKASRAIMVDGRNWKLSEWISSHLGPLARRKIKVAGKTQWYFTKTIRIPNRSSCR
jgi:hypothetical protein